MYCKTGPAIGPVGRGHLHRVQCETKSSGTIGRGHKHALAGCCSSCDHGGPCESQLGDVEQVKNTAFALALTAGAIWFGFWWTKPKKKRR
jgi:hypothetical protein